MTFSYRHRKQLFLALAMFVILVLGSFLLFRNQFAKKTRTTEKSVVLSGKEEEREVKSDQKEEAQLFQVDIKGEVVSPGIYTVKKGSRVIDVIRLAGDLTEFADTSVINLSKKVVDEMVIMIYSKDEVMNFTATKEEEQKKQALCEKPTEESIKNDACITSSIVVSGKISLNTATKEELLTLPGIGEAKATAILDYREEHGPFATIEEVKNVSGIGDSLFAQIKENITT